MPENKIYSARPINTYVRSADIGEAYVKYVSGEFPNDEVIDPNASEIQARAKELKAEHSIDPATGKHSEEYYNKVGGAKVMEYFTNEVVGPCRAGVGLLLPVMKNSRIVYEVGAGVAAELSKIHKFGRPVWVVTATKKPDGSAFFMKYRVHNISLNVGLVPKMPLCQLFITDHGFFRQMTVNETRARMYTKNPDGTWDREKLQPYFL